MEWIALFFVVVWLVSIFTDRKSPTEKHTTPPDKDDEKARIDIERIKRAQNYANVEKELRKLGIPSISKTTLLDKASSEGRSHIKSSTDERSPQQIRAAEQWQAQPVDQVIGITSEIDLEIAQKSIIEPEYFPPSVPRIGIQGLIEARGILHVVHFTRIENLASILTRGLISKTELREKLVESLVNDQYRYDNHPEAVCCSLSFPNYRMFYRVRCEQPNSDWAVIRLKPQILLEKRCLFCADNAASLSISNMPISALEGVRGLREMFQNHENMPPRDTLRIPDHYTTNPQAEVLVLESIEPDNIIDICLDSTDRIMNLGAIREIIEPFRDKFKFHHDRSLFAPRSDYEFWR